ncbi:hypothetical protein Tco_0008623, partial [Tanacetum coccineum]
MEWNVVSSPFALSSNVCSSTANACCTIRGTVLAALEIGMHSMVKAQNMKEHLEYVMQRVGISINSNPNHIEAIAKIITSDYYFNVAKLDTGECHVTLKNKQIVEIAEASVLNKQARPP